ncbi:3-hydroxyacyl-CoA dehydrogenase NAD-binding domain-containing protein [Azospirillum canadense]|uniref:3-hydroxyacyl-CoA dehydrogenase NAD-binding domain-containing protein n=1 Tax=Azospirillum canadense TaxID=403962 RepID=UPI002226CB9E|nr:3-hydroxyacyl-CoA dehydrogenase NAD-binding domain-containing protein [Azospirillum canadense]MCW2241803.1 3-hydroxyacyl-CoA dehydrogenase [Azospirillum canadense]
MTAVRIDRSDGVAVLTIANPPVNALAAAVRAGLDAALAEAQDDADVRAIVIAAEGRVFIAGADIAELGKPPLPPALPDLLRRIEGSGKPVVAAIGGAALGGGLELALACHARIVTPVATLGLPEIKLGLIPGAGGTQRLPRLIDPAAAFAMMRDGEPITAADAIARGLADAADGPNLLAAACARALELANGGRLLRTRDRTDRLTSEARAAFEREAADALRRSPELPNVPALVAAVRAAFERSFDEALAVEREGFLALIDDPRSRALRHVFFAERAAARVPDLSRDVPRRPVQRVAVVGAGTMGGGIAACFANVGIPVTLIEQEEEALKRGLDRLRATYDQSVKRGSLAPADRDRRLALIEGKVGLDHAGDADLIVEAAFEDMAVKAAIFATLDRVAKPGAILATNTSYLDVDAIAAATARPQDVIGLHFFSPANVMRLLEVVRGAATAPDVLATSLDLARRIGKLPVTVGVCFGFVGNRMLARRTAAAERLLLAGALPHEVDAAVTDFGFRMGPFAMMDMAGLDIGWRSRKATGAKAPVADALCELGRFGQKTGAGFYRYADGARVGSRDPEVEALIEGVSAKAGAVRQSFTAEAIIARLFYPMVNEGARILEERIAARPGDIDVVWLNGYGWPAWRGGPMHWADGVGLAHVAAMLDGFARETGDETLRPAPLLLRLAAAGESFEALGKAA